MNASSRIYVAGHRGLVGSAIIRSLQKAGFDQVIARTHAELDLTNAEAVRKFFAMEKPEYVFLAAAKVGGIYANSNYPVDFLQTNVEIQNNVIRYSYEAGVKRLLFLGSSCIYPKDAPQPIREDYLLTGPLEITNRAYALAKITGIEMCWSYNRQYGTRFLAAMPSNIYGPGDNFDLMNSHVLPALIRKAYTERKNASTTLEVWGSGTPRREFLHSDDLSVACLFLMQLPDELYEKFLLNDIPPLVNVGSGEDITIRNLAILIAEIVGYEGELLFDSSKPDGTPRKLMDTSKIKALGWEPKLNLREGIRSVYEAVKDSFEM